jgi:membrane protein DedA with SNARE-associated domain
MTSSLTTTLLNLFVTVGFAGIVLAMAIESCCIPLPSELTMPLAGALVFQGRIGFGGGHRLLDLVGITAAGALGELIGATVAYWIGAKGGRPLMLKYGRYVLISHHDADRADAFFAKYGEPTIFFGRLMPIVRTFISLPAGIARMDFRKFLTFTFLGSIIWCFALALAGYKLGENWTQVGGTIHKYEYIVVGLLAVLFALFIYRHVRRSSTSAEA